MKSKLMKAIDEANKGINKASEVKSDTDLDKLFQLNRWQKVYYPTKRFVRRFSPRDRYYDAKYASQRVRKGWSHRDVWSIDWHLMEILPEMLRHLAETTQGYPAGFGQSQSTNASIMGEESDEHWEAQYKAWQYALRLAASDIEAFYKFENSDVKFPKGKKAQNEYFEDSKKAQERTVRGMHWVANNFFSLWD